MLGTLLVLAAGSAVAYWFLVMVRHPEGFPPGPRLTLPLIGDMLAIGKSSTVGFRSLREKYGDVFGLFRGPLRTVVISDYDLIQEAAGSHDFSGRPMMSSVAEMRGGLIRSGSGMTIPGVLLSEGPVWVEQRRHTLHTLRDLGLGKNAMEDMIGEEVVELCRMLEATGGKAINVRNHFNITVLNSLWRIVSGDKLNHEDPKLLRLVTLLDTFLVESFRGINLVALIVRPLNHLLEGLGMLKGNEAFRQINAFVKENIETHQRTFQDDNLRDFIDRYLQEMRVQERKRELASFLGSDGMANLGNVLFDLFLAGSETTSTTLSWSILFLINNPEIQQKVRDELDRVTGRGRLPAWSDRDDTPYTEAVMHEIHRCGSIVNLAVMHSTVKDTHLGGRYFIPKDTQVFFNLGLVMKDPKTFPDPERFDPTRYLTEDGKFVPNPRVIPFGLGKRRCLGETIARVSFYRFFTGIVSTFELKKEHETDYVSQTPTYGSILSPLPYKVRFVPRN